ncbi:MAG: mechanosensitive ion channel family protein [Bacillota bacterium]
MMTYLLTDDFWAKFALSAGILILFLLLRKVFTRYIFKLIIDYTDKKGITTASSILNSFQKPVRWLFVVIGLQLALQFFPYDLISDTAEKKLFRSVFVVLAAWGLFNLSSMTTVLFPKLMSKLDINVDKLVVPFVSKMAKTLVIVLGGSMIAEEWGFNINGFIAGLGLGGLAFALAAKETVSNLFGGIVIVTEKPFTIGDWIKTPSVEGTVEDITFRSTKIRTFAQALVTVPNSTLANEPIINWSKMGKRQIAFHLGVTYSTSREKLQAIARRIELMLIEHEEIHNDTIIVRFDRFNDSSLDLYLYFFTNVTSFADYLSIKEDINFKILLILEEEGVSMAFPTRTLVVQSEGVQSGSGIIQEEKALLRSS